MTSLRRLLAYNMKESRKKLGLSQAKLAEKADLSTQYLAMVELERKFPSPEVLEKIAFALEIDTPELFSMPPSCEEEIKQFKKAILAEIEQSLGETIVEAAKSAVSSLVDCHFSQLQNSEKI